MANSLAINGLYNDPYLMQALNSPNYYQMKQAQQAGTQATNATQSSTPTAGTNNPSFQGGATNVANAGSGSGTGVAITLTSLAAVGGTALWLLNRGKGKGAKNFLEQIKLGWQSLGKNANSKKLQVLQKDGKTLVTIPKTTNKIQGSADSMKKQLEAIGLKDGDKAGLDILTTVKDGEKVLADGVKIRRGTYTLSNGNIVTFKNGKVVKYTDSTGKDILVQYTEPGRVAKYKGVNEANKKEIDDMLAGLNKGENLDKISNLVVTIEQNGILRKMTNTTTGSELNLNWAMSKKFDLNNKQVQAYRNNNKDIDEFLKQIESGKTDVGKIVGAEYTTKMHDGQKYTFVIENDTIKCLKDSSGRKLSQVDQDALEYNNKKTFEKVFKNKDKFENIIREAA